MFFASDSLCIAIISQTFTQVFIKLKIYVYYVIINNSTVLSMVKNVLIRTHHLSRNSYHRILVSEHYPKF